MVKNLRPNLSSTKVNASPRKLSQVHTSGWPNEKQVERKSQTCIDLRRLASPFGQGLTMKYSLGVVFDPKKYQLLTVFSQGSTLFLNMPQKSSDWLQLIAN